MTGLARLTLLLSLLTGYALAGFSQIDTLLIYNPTTQFGRLDIRVAKSDGHHYFLEEGKTFSFRQKDGVATNSFLDMTAWDSETYGEGNLRVKEVNHDKFVMNYRLLKPTQYDRDFSDGYPLVIVLHGLQESGNCAGAECYHGTPDYRPNENIPPAPSAPNSQLLNNDYNLVHGGSNYLDASRENGTHLPNDAALPARAFPGFVVFPQNLNGWDVTSVEDAIRLVRLLTKKYNIDESRIYINGVSHGGHGAYEMMKRAPWLFAAGILFSAADDANITAEKLVSIVSGIPLWIFQGGLDKRPTVKQTENYVRQLKEAGASVRYTLYEQLGHGTWNKAFSEPDFFTWMLGKRNNDIDVFGDNASICATTGHGAKLSVPKGFSEYQWEVDMNLISNQSNPVLVASVPGVYRARFRNQAGSWSDWSSPVTVVESSPATPEIRQVGTVLLKDPNQNNEAVLIADETASSYYWYRDGKRIDFPGDGDDTVRVARIKPSFGDGVYTLKTSAFDKCISPPSEAKHLFFNDRAPINLDPPTGLKFSDLRASSVVISWQHNSTNGSGFEVWRRKTDEENSLWNLVALTDKITNSFHDTHLHPSSSYEYLVRAVGESGRSNYLRSNSIDSPEDNQAPSSPTNLIVEIKGVKKMSFNWERSRDNSAIKEYWIFMNGDTLRTGSSDTSFVWSDFVLNTHYKFYIVAVDVGRNLSGQSNEVIVYSKVSGLFYEHSTGAWNSLNEIDWSLAEVSGKVESFTLSPKTQEDFFNFRFDGYLHVEKHGVYQFRISSNDGSRLSLDDTLLVLNDGIHNLTTITAPIQVLESGPHRITVDFFDNVLTDSLMVEYKGPDTGSEWIVIPSEKLSSDTISLEEEIRRERKFDFDVYPNPAQSGRIELMFNTEISGLISVSLLTANGQRVYGFFIDQPEPGKNIVLDQLPSLPNGLYTVLVLQGDFRRAKRIVINR